MANVRSNSSTKKVYLEKVEDTVRDKAEFYPRHSPTQ